jgi:hypothetical protein
MYTNFTELSNSKLKTSTSSPNPVLTRNPELFAKNIPYPARRIAEEFILIYNEYGNIYPSYKYLADKTGYGVPTIKKYVGWLADQGLIKKDYRRKETNVYTLSRFFFKKKIRAAISSIFSILPVIHKNMSAFCLSLLFSFNIHVFGIAIGRDIKILESLPETISLNNVVYSRAGTGARETLKELMSLPTIRLSMDQKKSVVVKSDKIKGICRALIARGTPSPVTNDDALMLYAYSDDVLDYACNVMKHAKPNNPVAFFISECKKRALSMNDKPNWDVVRYAREQKIVLLNDRFFEGLAHSAASRSEEKTSKTGRGEQLYAERVKLDKAKERAAAEARKPKIEAIEAEISNYKALIAANEATCNANPFTKIAHGLAIRALKNLEYDLAELTQKSTTPNDPGPDNGTTPPPGQNVYPVPNLKMSRELPQPEAPDLSTFDIAGVDDVEDVPYCWESHTDDAITDVPRSSL